MAFYQIQKWQKHNFAEHPTIKNLSKYINEEHPTWTQIASEINTEYRRVTKVLLEVNPITSVVITDNWILKIDLFETHIAKISDTDMLVSESREFSVTDDLGDHQMLKVDFNSVNGKFKNFQINMFVSGLRQLESQLQRQIRMAPGITVHRTEAEMFLAAFANAVKKNPKYTATEVTVATTKFINHIYIGSVSGVRGSLHRLLPSGAKCQVESQLYRRKRGG